MLGRPPYALLSPPPSDLRPTLQPRERPSLSQYRRSFSRAVFVPPSEPMGPVQTRARFVNDAC